MSKIKNIKWEKGFLRIWAVGSIVWFLSAIWMYSQALKYSYSKPVISEYVLWALAWPIGILVFAYAAKFLIKFIVQGFK